MPKLGHLLGQPFILSLLLGTQWVLRMGAGSLFLPPALQQQSEGSLVSLVHTQPSPLLPPDDKEQQGSGGMLLPLELDFLVLLKSRRATEKGHEIMENHQACLYGVG